MSDSLRRILVGAPGTTTSNLVEVTSTTVGSWTSTTSGSNLLESPVAVQDFDLNAKANYIAIATIAQPSANVLLELRAYDKPNYQVSANTANGFTKGSSTNIFRYVKWAPDGKYFATIADNDTGGNLSIWYTGQDASGDVRLDYVTSSLTSNHLLGLEWHPAGNYIVSRETRTDDSLKANLKVWSFAANALTNVTSPTNVSRINDVYSIPKFNKAGTRLAFSGNVGTGSQAYNIHVFNTSQTPWISMSKNFDTPIEPIGEPGAFNAYILGNLSSTSELPVSANNGASYFVGANLYIWNAGLDNQWGSAAVSSMTYKYKTFDDIESTNYHPDAHATGYYTEIRWLNNDTGFAAVTLGNVAFPATEFLEVYDLTTGTQTFGNGVERTDTYSWTRQSFTGQTFADSPDYADLSQLHETRDNQLLYFGKKAFESNATNRYINGVDTGIGTNNLRSFDLLLVQGAADLEVTADWFATYDRTGIPTDTDHVYAGPDYWQEGYCVIEWVGDATLTSVSSTDGYAEIGYAVPGYFDYEGITADKFSGPAETTITATATIEAVPSYTRGIVETTLNSQATVDASASQIIGTDTTLTATASVNATAEVYSGGVINLTSSATVHVDGNVYKGLNEVLASRFSQLTQAGITVSPAVNLYSENFAEITAVGRKTSEVYLDAVSQVIVGASVTNRPSLELVSAFGLTAEGDVKLVTRSTANLTANSTVVSSAVKTARPVVQLTANATVTTQAGLLTNTLINLASTASVIATGRIISVEPVNRLYVTEETRFYPVLAEDRRISTAEESRVNSVLNENRTLEVAQETRILAVD